MAESRSSDGWKQRGDAALEVHGRIGHSTAEAGTDDRVRRTPADRTLGDLPLVAPPDLVRQVAALAAWPESPESVAANVLGIADVLSLAGWSRGLAGGASSATRAGPMDALADAQAEVTTLTVTVDHCAGGASMLAPSALHAPAPGANAQPCAYFGHRPALREERGPRNGYRGAAGGCAGAS